MVATACVSDLNNKFNLIQFSEACCAIRCFSFGARIIDLRLSRKHRDPPSSPAEAKRQSRGVEEFRSVIYWAASK